MARGKLITPSLAARAAHAELVRQSAAVNEARAEPFLEGAVLAAEQVQDVRIAVLERPAELTATQFWTEVAITIIVDSNLASKLLSAATKAIFKPIVRINALFRVLPKSQLGRELSYAAKLADEVGMSGRSVIRNGILGLPGTASPDALKLYHSGVQLLVTSGSKLDIAKAAVKVVNQVARPKNQPRSNRPLGGPDSAGVAVLHSAMEYAAATRLGIRFAHAAIERVVWTTDSYDDLTAIANEVDWGDLTDPKESDAFQAGLTVIRKEATRFFEALIWSRMYAFSVANRPGAVNNPRISSNTTYPFPDVKPDLQNYWHDRFQSDADAYAITSGAPVQSGTFSDALRLLRYFAALSEAVDKYGMGIGRKTLLVTP
jgi:hypothetical protein